MSVTMLPCGGWGEIDWDRRDLTMEVRCLGHRRWLRERSGSFMTEMDPDPKSRALRFVGVDEPRCGAVTDLNAAGQRVIVRMEKPVEKQEAA
jgi:hypothetical protein